MPGTPIKNDVKDVDLAALAATLNISESDLRALQAKNALTGVRTSVATALTGVVEQVLDAQPCKPSSKDTSAWVGSILSGIEVSVGGTPYTVTVTVKDENASKARKETLGQ